MTRSISFLAVALALSLGATAAQAQDAANKAATPAAKAAAAKAASKAAPATAAKDAMGRSVPSQTKATQTLAPIGAYPQSSPKDGSSGCHSKDSDA